MKGPPHTLQGFLLSNDKLRTFRQLGAAAKWLTWVALLPDRDNSGRGWYHTRCCRGAHYG